MAKHRHNYCLHALASFFNPEVCLHVRLQFHNFLLGSKAHVCYYYFPSVQGWSRGFVSQERFRSINSTEVLSAFSKETIGRFIKSHPRLTSGCIQNIRSQQWGLFGHPYRKHEKHMLNMVSVIKYHLCYFLLW